MTEIYLHIYARMADYIRTHPYARDGFNWISSESLVDLISRRNTRRESAWNLLAYLRCVRNSSAILHHARLRFTYIFDARVADYIRTHP